MHGAMPRQDDHQYLWSSSAQVPGKHLEMECPRLPSQILWSISLGYPRRPWELLEQWP